MQFSKRGGAELLAEGAGRTRRVCTVDPQVEAPFNSRAGTTLGHSTTATNGPTIALRQALARQMTHKAPPKGERAKSRAPRTTGDSPGRPSATLDPEPTGVDRVSATGEDQNESEPQGESDPSGIDPGIHPQVLPHTGDPDKALQNLIAGRLDELGIGPFTAARVAGIPQDTIRNVLRGQSPKYGNLQKICNALHLRLTIEPIENRDAARRSPTTESKESTEGPKKPATGRQAAKEDVRATYDTSRPRQEIVDHLRGVPKEIIAEVIDEMLNERSHEDAEELREMASDAGHEIY